jgi:hypothetical protein
MKAQEIPVLSSDFTADEKAVMESFLHGTPLDPEVASRIHERAQQIRAQILQKHGVVDIAVPAIRELRG